MDRFLKNVFLFSVFFSIGYPLIIFLAGVLPVPQALKPNLNFEIGSYGHMFTRIQELKQLNKSVDILILGSSHAYRGFDPRKFKNKRVFNLGSSSQTPIQTKVLLERYLEKLNPKIVFYEVFPEAFSSDGVESSLDLIANDKNDFKSLRMAFQVNNIKVYNTLIYASIIDIFKSNKDFVEPIRKNSDTYIYGGYVERDMNCFKLINYKMREWSFKKVQLTAFHESIRLLKKRNAKVILVFAPITPRLYNSYTNNHYVDSIFKSCNLEYYNFNKLIQLNDSLDFYDMHHLNKKGVELFNNKLIEMIKL